jgi:hypothetical protein
MYNTGLHPLLEACESGGDLTLLCHYNACCHRRLWNIWLWLLFSLNFSGQAPISKFLLILALTHAISMDIAILEVDVDLNWVFLYSFHNTMELQEAMRHILANCS